MSDCKKTEISSPEKNIRKIYLCRWICLSLSLFFFFLYMFDKRETTATCVLHCPGNFLTLTAILHSPTTNGKAKTLENLNIQMNGALAQNYLEKDL